MKVSELIDKLSEEDGDSPVVLRVWPEDEQGARTDHAAAVRHTTRGGAAVIIEGRS